MRGSTRNVLADRTTKVAEARERGYAARSWLTASGRLGHPTMSVRLPARLDPAAVFAWHHVVVSGAPLGDRCRRQICEHRILALDGVSLMPYRYGVAVSDDATP